MLEKTSKDIESNHQPIPTTLLIAPWAPHQRKGNYHSLQNRNVSQRGCPPQKPRRQKKGRLPEIKPSSPQPHSPASPLLGWGAPTCTGHWSESPPALQRTATGQTNTKRVETNTEPSLQEERFVNPSRFVDPAVPRNGLSCWIGRLTCTTRCALENIDPI